jgi:hypothetical protein
MRVYEQVSANGRESGVLNLYSQLAGRGGRVGIGRGGWVRVNRKSGSNQKYTAQDPRRRFPYMKLSAFNEVESCKI